MNQIELSFLQNACIEKINKILNECIDNQNAVQKAKVAKETKKESK